MLQYVMAILNATEVSKFIAFFTIAQFSHVVFDKLLIFYYPFIDHLSFWDYFIRVEMSFRTSNLLN